MTPVDFDVEIDSAGRLRWVTSALGPEARMRTAENSVNRYLTRWQVANLRLAPQLPTKMTLLTLLICVGNQEKSDERHTDYMRYALADCRDGN